QALEHLAGLADEGDTLAILVVAGRLAHEHQVGVGMPGPDHDLSAGALEGTFLTALPLGGQPLEFGRTGGCIAHGAHFASGAGRLSGRSMSAAAAAAAAPAPAPAASAPTGHHRPRRGERREELGDGRAAAVGTGHGLVAPHEL